MMRRLALLGALAAVGCTRPRTEAVIVVQTAGVRIPLDVEKLHVQVADHTPGGDDMAMNDVVYEQDVVLCHERLAVGCYDVPVTASLFPGKRHPNDSVRVQIDALGAGGKPVISDAALFTFADGQRLRIDFVLYANCLGNVDCAKRDQACGPDDKCVDVTPAPLGGKPDLAPLGMPDLSTGAPLDLGGGPPDLTPAVDMAGCDAVSCGPGTTCVAGSCVSCGGLGEPCCASGAQCAAGNLVCDGTSCVSCGTPPQLCCANDQCFNSLCNLGNDRCEYPPPPDMLQSPPDMLSPNDDMSPPDMILSPDDMSHSFPSVDAF